MKDNKFTWADFLEVRASIVRQWRAEGSSFEDIARRLSCDPMQVQLISMTDGPIGHPGNTLSDRLNRAAISGVLKEKLELP
jgi:hypothetical protein